MWTRLGHQRRTAAPGCQCARCFARLLDARRSGSGRFQTGGRRDSADSPLRRNWADLSAGCGGARGHRLCMLTAAMNAWQGQGILRRHESVKPFLRTVNGKPAQRQARTGSPLNRQAPWHPASRRCRGCSDSTVNQSGNGSPRTVSRRSRTALRSVATSLQLEIVEIRSRMTSISC